MYMAYRTNQKTLFAFIATTALISFIYHLNETKLSLLFDEFASCALIIVTSMVYINDAYSPTYIMLALLIVVVAIEYYYEVDVIDFFVGISVLVAVVVFLYERSTVTETPQRLKVKDTYFIAFISTQLIAIAFFVWDKEPYAHSLWHLFAFVSLGTAIAHIHEHDADLKRVAFYCLGSIPSRFFIAAIFIHWDTAAYPSNVPIATGALLLGLSMAANGPFRGLSYMGIGAVALLEQHNMAAVGVWLILDSLVSAYLWYKRNRGTVGVSKVPAQYKKIQLENLRF